MTDLRKVADGIIADARANKLEKIDIDLVRSRLTLNYIPLTEANELYVLRRVVEALA